MANLRPLQPELQKVAESELGEVPDRIPDDLEALKSWIKQLPHLNARLDEQFLIQYLRGCKYSLEKAKEKIDIFFTLKSKFPELFNAIDVNSATFRTTYHYGFGIPLPRPLNDNGARIYFIQFKGDIGKGLVDIEELYRVMNAMHEIIIMDDPFACINGIIYIVDLKDITLNMATKYTPNILKKLMEFYHKSLPLRIKGIHFINMPGFFQSVISLVMPLFSEKMKDRISINGQNYDSLYKMVPKEYLPKHLGGDNGSLEELLINFDQKWLEYSDYFKENANYGTNESLRPGKPIDFESIYGWGGSFRKLDMD